MKQITILILSVMFLMAVCAANTSAYIITDFSPSSYVGGSASDLERMEETLGIKGMEIEDFADSVIKDGLSITGTHNWILDGNRPQWGATGTFSFRSVTSSTTINIAGGTSTLGFGFTSLELRSQIWINGQAYGSFYRFPNFLYGPEFRNGYLTIEAEPGEEEITSVWFYSSGVDGYGIDYIAFDNQPVPEPSSCLLIGLGLIGLAAGARRKMEK